MILHLRDLTLLVLGLLCLNAKPNQAAEQQSAEHRDPPTAPAPLIPIFQDVIDSGELSAEAVQVLQFLSQSDRTHSEHPTIEPDEHIGVHVELNELFEELLAEGDLAVEATNYLKDMLKHMAAADETIAAQHGEEALGNSADLRDIRQLVSAAIRIERALDNDSNDEELLARRTELVTELVDRVIEWLDRVEAIDDKNAPHLLRLLAPSFGPQPANKAPHESHTNH